MRHTIAWSVILGGILCAAGSARSQTSYTIRALGSPPASPTPGAYIETTYKRIIAINNRGHVFYAEEVPHTPQAGWTKRLCLWTSAGVTILGGRPQSICNWALNDKDQIVVTHQNAGQTTNWPKSASMWDGTHWVDLPPLPHFTDTSALAIDNNGTVFGFSRMNISSSVGEAVRDRLPLCLTKWVNAKPVSIGPVSGTGDYLTNTDYPRAASESGAFVGNGVVKDTSCWVFATGKFVFVGGQADARDWGLRPTAVNGRGHVVGVAMRGGGTRPFQWAPFLYNGEFLLLQAPQSKDGSITLGNLEIPVAINAADLAVGCGRATGRQEVVAKLWQAGRAVDLNTCIPAASGWKLAEATSINDNGQIVGVGKLHGVTRYFLLTPR